MASDVVAFGAMAAIRERGLTIPNDIALVGFDDIPLARYVDPPLTSVHLPAAELGRQAGRIIVGLIQECDTRNGIDSACLVWCHARVGDLTARRMESW